MQRLVADAGGAARRRGGPCTSARSRCAHTSTTSRRCPRRCPSTTTSRDGYGSRTDAMRLTPARIGRPSWPPGRSRARPPSRCPASPRSPTSRNGGRAGSVLQTARRYPVFDAVTALADLSGRRACAATPPTASCGRSAPAPTTATSSWSRTSTVARDRSRSSLPGGATRDRRVPPAPFRRGLTDLSSRPASQRPVAAQATQRVTLSRAETRDASRRRSSAQELHRLVAEAGQASRQTRTSHGASATCVPAACTASSRTDAASPRHLARCGLSGDQLCTTHTRPLSPVERVRGDRSRARDARMRRRRSGRAAAASRPEASRHDHGQGRAVQQRADDRDRARPDVATRHRRPAAEQLDAGIRAARRRRTVRARRPSPSRRCRPPAPSRTTSTGSASAANSR